MALTDIDICSNALVMLGDNAISSFADGTTGATVAGQLYQSTVDRALGRRLWHFTKVQAQLSRLVLAPSARWSAAYQLPVDCDRIQAILVGGYPIAFDRYGEGQIYCDAGESDTVYAEYLCIPDEATWPPYFRVYVEALLATAFAIPVTGRDELKTAFEKTAELLYYDARQADGGGRTPGRFPISRFITARTGRA